VGSLSTVLALRPNLTEGLTIIHSHSIEAVDTNLIERLHITRGNTMEDFGGKLVTLGVLTGKLTIDEHLIFILG
jgi:hypothetical protein